MRRCAFVNYTKKEDSEKAIKDFHVSMLNVKHAGADIAAYNMSIPCLVILGVK